MTTRTRRTSKLAEEEYQPRPATSPAASEPGGQTPRSAPLDDLSPNPKNPRDADLDVEELAESLLEIGQLQAATVVARPVFLALYPEHADDINQTSRWVVVNGNRRLAAARKAGWRELKIDVADHLGADDDRIDDAVIIENIHRQDLPPLREAAHLARMVQRHGSQRKVAKRIGKTQPYISQRLSLLDLLPELQEALATGQLGIAIARKLANRTADEQQDLVDALKQLLPPLREAVLSGAVSPADTRLLAELPESEQQLVVDGGPPFSPPPRGDNQVIAPAEAEGPAESDNRVITSPNQDEQSTRPTQRTPSLVIRVSPHSPEELAVAIRSHLTDEEQHALARLLTERT